MSNNKKCELFWKSLACANNLVMISTDVPVKLITQSLPNYYFDGLRFKQPQCDSLRFKPPLGDALRFKQPLGDGLRFKQPLGDALRFKQPLGDALRFKQPL